jgi:hypothetical protein
VTFLRIAAILALLSAVAGCATTDQESELPWNMSQPWETAPALPGGLGGGY